MNKRYSVPIFAMTVLLLASAESNAVPATIVEFGSYLNCVVNNRLGQPIQVEAAQYQVNGHQGPAYSRPYICSSNCILAPGQIKKIGGPPNHHDITGATCSINYTVLR